MTPATRRRSSHREQLLKLWMGDLDNHEPPRRASAAVVAATLGSAVLLATLLARFAIDVLLIGLALLAVALVLNVLGTWLAESDLLSPGWFLALLLAVGVGAWALVSPASNLEKLGKLVPRPVVKFVEWTESKGWGQRAFLRTGGQGPGVDPARQTAPTAVSPPSQPVEPEGRSSAASALTVSTSTTTARPGEPIVLTARVRGGAGWISAGTVSFFDGLTLLGESPLVMEGGIQVASITVNLAEGRHDVTVSTGGRLGPRSEAVRIVVGR